MFNKECVTVLFFVSIIAITGCKKNNQPVSSTTEDIICASLYQKNDSIANALNFIEAPQEKLETYISIVQNNGKLVSGDLLKFANKYLSLATNKNTDMYISMLSTKTKEILDDVKKNGVIHYNLNAIKAGTFVNSKDEHKYLAISSVVSKELQNTLRRANFTEMPTHRIIFYYFDRSRDRLLSSTVYLIEEQGSYKIVTEEMPMDQLESINLKNTKTDN